MLKYFPIQIRLTYKCFTIMFHVYVNKAIGLFPQILALDVIDLYRYKQVLFSDQTGF